MLHSMLFLFSAFVAPADVVTTPSSNKDLPVIQIQLPDQILRNIAAVHTENVRPSQWVKTQTLHTCTDPNRKVPSYRL
ncbi:unnamed protein product [Cylicostephanus goldi]|uniref:Secreted protein n=1 Tax=Cylicostephanus goldi TaxID=71465 RepID=A0A3P7NCJ6_CYLGO|nr:unnamed protein product [Cylicostephanus goldi]